MHTGMSSSDSSSSSSSLSNSSSPFSSSPGLYAATAPSVDLEAESPPEEDPLYLASATGEARTSMLGLACDPATPTGESLSAPRSSLSVAPPPPGGSGSAARRPLPPHNAAAILASNPRGPRASSSPSNRPGLTRDDWVDADPCLARAADDARSMSVYLGRLTGTHFLSFSLSLSVASRSFSRLANGSTGAYEFILRGLCRSWRATSSADNPPRLSRPLDIFALFFSSRAWRLARLNTPCKSFMLVGFCITSFMPAAWH